MSDWTHLWLRGWLSAALAAGLLVCGRAPGVLAGDQAAEAQINQGDPHVDLTRGPYLMIGTPTGVTVRWRTSTASIGRVWYGTETKNQRTVDEKIATLEHEIVLTGLTPNTRYVYAVGAGDKVLAGEGGDCSFVTHPNENAAKPVRIWVLGDSGTADGSAMAVRNAFRSYAAVRPADLWLMLGDNAYVRGTDTEYQSAVFDMYAEELRTSVLWPTRGNHDVVHEGPNNDYYEIFTLPTQAEAGGVASGTEAYYSFNYAKVHFICLDSEGTSLKPDSPMWTWLKQDLAAVRQDWIVAFWHHPPYSKGSHDSDTESKLVAMREQALPILEAGGVDLVLSGHSHSYERSYLVDGHYGKSDSFTEAMKKVKGDGRVDGEGAYTKTKLGVNSHGGAVYAVAGSSGKVSGGALNHPVMFLSMKELGSMVIDINGNQLDAIFLQPGAKEGDSFRILKGGNGKDITPPEIVATRMVDGTHVDVAFSEKLEPKTAENPQHYTLLPNGVVKDQPGPVISAKVQADGQTVRLEQANLAPGTTASKAGWTTWRVAAKGVADLAGNPPNPNNSFTFPTAIPPQTDLPFGSVWKYDATATDLKDAWLKVDFDDSRWLSGAGQLGYGDDDEATPIPKAGGGPSYYFRRKIQLRGTVSDAKLTVIHDDGVIVWINGKQVFSKYADKGADFDATASKQSDDNESSKASIGLQPNPFVDGENVVCVMVKQIDKGSSDLSFDLELSLKVQP